MGTAATEVVVAGQTIIVRGERQDVAAICKPRTLTRDDGLREVVTVDGETVTFNIAAVGLVRAAVETKQRGAFGFARVLDGGDA